MHHKSIHDKDNWLQCDLCTYRCATSGNLKTHMDGKHNETPSYPCPECDSVFKTSSARSIHKVRIIITIITTLIITMVCARNTYGTNTYRLFVP